MNNQLFPINLAFAGVVIITMAISYLALTNTWHANEPHLSLEWNRVRVAFAVQLLFVTWAIYAAYRFKRNIANNL